ncbi:zinc ribbon domain-containing protein [Pseudomonas sp. ABC1]|uniref:FmdB family zinc ribbon protein n=1 Tax=Pseudomonas sp. ABC1 TaxID=2748080 RepID=UPI0015C3C278|nr:zinc ribbon domain-containing protein [Pseudomonas sp. ABC1]QLF93083.1 zinc ribbon domain-containing protein [Pseudomonas sp. ABC1]
MPIYEYDCPACGDFTLLRSLAEREQPCACPACGQASVQVIRSAPRTTSMPASLLRSHEVNERSRHAPQSLAEYKNNRRHPAGCSCCSTSKKPAAAQGEPAPLKSAGSRPWMISH